MRALKFAASAALLLAAGAFGQQTTPYINPWANAGAPGQGALPTVGTAAVTASIVGGGMYGGPATYPPAYTSYPSQGSGVSASNPGLAVPPSDPNNQYGNGGSGYGSGYGNGYGSDPYSNEPKAGKYPLVDISPFFSGDCSSNPCLNGGQCFDRSLYAQLSGNTIAAPGQFDTANAGDAESQLATALAGKPVPNTYSRPYNQVPKMSWCKCTGPWFGKFCENRQCDPNQKCSDDSNDQLLVVFPRNVQVECGSYMGATAAGAGAAVAADSCRQASFTTQDRYETGPQNCPESMMVRRTFVGTDQCGKTAQGMQSIAVVDTKPPKVRAKLVPFPPLAVSASQIVLTPDQVKAIVKVLIAVGIESKKQSLLLSDPKLALLAGKGLLLFDGLNLNTNDVNSLLNGLVGRDLSRSNMTDVLGSNAASLLLANGFDDQSIMGMLKADPTLGGAKGLGAINLGGLSGLSGLSGLGGLSSLFGSGVASNVAGQVQSQLGQPTTIVRVPDSGNDDGFKNWMMSNIALPVGAQVCSEPSTRVFAVNCTAVDKCTPGKRLKAAARLKVTYVVGRRTIGVPDELNDPMFLADPLKAMKDPLFGKDKMMHKVMDKNVMDEHQRALRDDLSKKIGVDFNKMATSNSGSSISPYGNVVPMATTAAPVLPVDSASVTTSATSSGGDAIDLSTLIGNRVMDYDAMMKEGGYTADPKANYDPKNMQYGNPQYGNQYGGYGNNQYDPKNNYASGYGNGYNDPKKHDPKKDDPKHADPNDGTAVFAFQCRTAVAYVPVHCGDMVSITLDPEDVCLANQFDANNNKFMMNHVFSVKDFKGDVKKEMKDKGFTDQGFVSRTSWNAISVRGTAVELEVLAEDECYNVGKGFDEPARDCETFVSGKCCAPVSNGLSQFAINQVLQSTGADQPHFMGTSTMQLSDINFKLP